MSDRVVALVVIDYSTCQVEAGNRTQKKAVRYRSSGREVISVICEFSDCLQRIAVDKVFIDLTKTVTQRGISKSKITSARLKNTFVFGYSKKKNDEEERERGVRAWLEDVYSSDLLDPDLHRLALAAAVVEKMRAAVFEKTGFRCLAGISHNKVLAKLASNFHSKNQQTVLPKKSIADFYKTLPLINVPNLGEKLVKELKDTLGINYVGDLARYSEKQWQMRYKKTGTWLYNISQGIDLDPVTPPKEVESNKKFTGEASLSTKTDVIRWLTDLANQLVDQLDEDLHVYKRKAQLLAIYFGHNIGNKRFSKSGVVPLPGYEAESIASCAFNYLAKKMPTLLSDELTPLKYLGLAAQKFVEVPAKTYREKTKAKNIKLNNNIDARFSLHEPFLESENSDERLVENHLLPLQQIEGSNAEHANQSNDMIIDVDKWDEEHRDECIHCQDSVLKSELQEHLDYHLAKQIHIQWHKEPVPTRNIVPIKTRLSIGTLIPDNNTEYGSTSVSSTRVRTSHSYQ